MKLKELFKSEANWCQRSLALDKDSNPTGYYSPDAVCWCLEGGIAKCYVENFEIRKKIASKIYADNMWDFTFWNDNPLRTFQDIYKLVNELDI